MDVKVRQRGWNLAVRIGHQRLWFVDRDELDDGVVMGFRNRTDWEESWRSRSSGLYWFSTASSSRSKEKRGRAMSGSSSSSSLMEIVSIL